MQAKTEPSMTDFANLAVTDYGSVMSREHFIDNAIHPLWQGMQRIAGPAYTVQLTSGDNLMLHSAIYEAPEGSIIVADAGNDQYAIAGGNVCAIAQNNGIKGFVIDGVIRDLAEIIEMKFPVYANGVFPVPGKKEFYSELAQPINCGGVEVKTGDIIVADIEGIVVIPKQQASEIYAKAKAKFDEEAATSIDDWEAAHRTKVERALEKAKQI